MDISYWCSNVIYYPGHKVKHDGICYVATNECNKPDAESNINKTPGEMDDNFWNKEGGIGYE